jgi:hypothetical protein
MILPAMDIWYVGYILPQYMQVPDRPITVETVIPDYLNGDPIPPDALSGGGVRLPVYNQARC